MCQPKSRERSKSACPAHPQELDDDEDNKPIVQSDRTTVSEEEDEDNESLVQPASKEEALKRESSAERGVLA